jgi:hypothetical protein
MPTDYPPLPEPEFFYVIDAHGGWGPSAFWDEDRACDHAEMAHGPRPYYAAFTESKLHAYLATERARIEREVMPTLNSLIPLLRFSEAGRVHDEILRAIRGEKEPT